MKTRQSVPNGPGSSAEAPVTEPRGRTILKVAAVVAVAVAALGLTAWGMWSWLDRPLQTAPATAEYTALQAKLTDVRGALRPIAESFTSEPATGPIDLTSYRDRVENARRVVESVNDIPLTSRDAIEARDLILTGGTQVLDGLSDALDALASDDASATQDAATLVELGLTQLDEAAALLEELQGGRSSV